MAAVLHSTLARRPQAPREREYLASGLSSLDALSGGFPRGAIAEITGPDGSGRTTVAGALLAAATARGEICALVDTDNAFDPVTASRSGIDLSRLLWIRCGGNAAHAMKAADLVLHAGGFGAVILDLSHVAPRAINRIPISYWHRFRLAIENTLTVLVIVERQPQAKSCAALMLEMKRRRNVFTGAPGFELMRGIECEALSRKPVRQQTALLRARMAG